MYVFTTSFVNVSERLKFQVVPRVVRWSLLHFHGSMGPLPGILFNLIFLSDPVILLTIVFLCISSSYFRLCRLTSPSLVRTTTMSSSFCAFLFSVEFELCAAVGGHRWVTVRESRWFTSWVSHFFFNYFYFVCVCVRERAEVTASHTDEGPAEIVMKCYWLRVLYLVSLCSLVFKAVPLALKSTLHGRTLT